LTDHPHRIDEAALIRPEVIHAIISARLLHHAVALISDTMLIVADTVTPEGRQEHPSQYL
jgi:hypothetical protein